MDFFSISETSSSANPAIDFEAKLVSLIDSTGHSGSRNLLLSALNKKKPAIVRVGVSLFELLVVLGILAALVSLLFPAIQRIRSNSRVLSCQNKIRQLGLSVHDYESSFSRFPVGTNGYSNVVNWREYKKVPSEPYWKFKQQTSFAVFLLSFLGEDNLVAKIDSIMLELHRDLKGYRKPDGSEVEWFGLLDGFDILASTALPSLLCSDDDLDFDRSINFLGGSQPVFEDSVNSDSLSYVFLNQMLPGVQFKGTNYLGCSGAFSGGIHPDPTRNAFRGIMSSGERIGFETVIDGLSNTLMLGESLGEIQNGNRIAVQSWVVGGLARGRANVEWRQPAGLGARIVGDRSQSSVFGFAATHDIIANFSMGDGAVRGIEKSIDWDVFYRLTGISDSGMKLW